MLAARALQAFVHSDPKGHETSEEEAIHGRVGALLVFELLWHLRALSGQDLQIKIVK